MRRKCVRVLLSDAIIARINALRDPGETLSSVVRAIIDQHFDDKDSPLHQVNGKLDRVLAKLNAMNKDY